MLKQRILSAFLLLPLPILALYFGPPWFELVCAVSLTAMGWEWEKLVLKRFSVLGMLIAVTRYFSAGHQSRRRVDAARRDDCRVVCCCQKTGR